ncbi:MAG TPA: thioredoxin-like domain-containing protein, partial [Lacipirellulaceae bacterium]
MAAAPKFRRNDWYQTGGNRSIGLVVICAAVAVWLAYRHLSGGSASAQSSTAAAAPSRAGELEKAVGQNPFPTRVAAPPLDGGEWVNTAGPMSLADLRGRFVLLDFWTYCCINCMHVLPELKKLEHAYPNELVVIGIHSAKFEGEQVSENIREAAQRYEIEHP